MTQRSSDNAADTGQSSWAGRIEALVLIPNLVFVGIVVLYLIAVQGGGKRVAPLVQGAKATEARIAALERSLEREPRNVESAIELAQLYQQVGEFPWSYNALLTAEQQGSREPRWRLMLGLAYLEMGKNDDAIRVLSQTRSGCTKRPGTCDQNLVAKLRIFGRLARMFQKRGIDSSRHSAAAEKVLHEILKPVEVDPAKMRPKAPAPTKEGTPPAEKPSKG